MAGIDLFKLIQRTSCAFYLSTFLLTETDERDEQCKEILPKRPTQLVGTIHNMNTKIFGPLVFCKFSVWKTSPPYLAL